MLSPSHVDPDPVDDDGKTPLYNACKTGRADIVTALLDFGADIERRQPGRPRLPGRGLHASTLQLRRPRLLALLLRPHRVVATQVEFESKV